MLVRAYDAQQADRWDAWCGACYGATFLHTRRFLGYHGDRFVDRSLIIENDAGDWLGVMPLAQHPADATQIVSHPGITYGGVVHAGRLRGEAMVSALRSAGQWLAALGYRRLLYRPVPDVYALAPAQDDLYALFRLGARLTRRDLSSCIDLQQRLPVSERRRRALKRARLGALTHEVGAARLADLWPVVQDNLARAHGLEPVHTLAEIEDLAARFPQQIECRIVRHEKQVLAGLVLFVTPRVVHAQYIASSERGQDCHALDLLFDRAIEDAQSMRARYFDFGISTVDQGRCLNVGLHQFKSEFGAGGVVHDHYELML